MLKDATILARSLLHSTIFQDSLKILFYSHRPFPTFHILTLPPQKALIKIQHIIIKHASYQVPAPICFSTVLPSSGTLLTTKHCQIQQSISSGAKCTYFGAKCTYFHHKN